MTTSKCTCHPNYRAHFGRGHHPNCAMAIKRPTYFAYEPTKAEMERARQALINAEALWDER